LIEEVAQHTYDVIGAGKYPNFPSPAKIAEAFCKLQDEERKNNG
jgi:hypothetical protein